MANQTKTKGKTVIQVDGYTRVCLTVIAVLLSVLIVGLWAETAPGESRVFAQDGNPPKLMLDAAGQRKAAIEAQEKTTGKLEELITLFKTGQAKVQITDRTTSSRNSSRAGSNVQIQKHKSK